MIFSLIKGGEGVTQDYKQAFYWYKLSAEEGHASAQYNLGWMHDNGEGVLQDYKQAVYWYTKAAEQGNAFAMYDQGQGVTQNYINAYIWSSLAAIQGDKDAAKNRDLLAKKLTSQQLAEAQELAAQMQEKIDSVKK